VEPLSAVGQWLAKNGEAAYGKVELFKEGWGFGSGLCALSKKANTVYAWNWIYPPSGELIIGGFTTKLASARMLGTGQKLSFVQEKYRIILRDLPKEGRDTIAGVTVIALEFEGRPETVRFAARPPLNRGRVYS
jgi:hypothetical protein